MAIQYNSIRACTPDKSGHTFIRILFSCTLVPWIKFNKELCGIILCVPCKFLHFPQPQRQILIHIPLVPLINTQAGPGWPDTKYIITPEIFFSFFQKPEKIILSFKPVIIFMVPGKLKCYQIFIAYPFQVFPLIKRIIERLQIIQVPVPEH